MKKIFVLLAAAVLFVPLRGGEAEHRQAAIEMMEASGVPEMLKRAFRSQLENQFKAVPELEKLRPELTRFYDIAFSYESLKGDLANLYMKHYTVEELKQITAFYRTPAGRKKAVEDGKMSSEMGELFLRHSQKKMPELQKMLQKLAK